ncbi:heavy metal-associated isoprenylated plant protein 39 isoform X1 [Salvia miltiorrhiza]|uniref:heavy metal-associated isoprenylated plant protein 39 isoform X1 n=1 Tax=Salvia miltiorrhiza TaxID=226208 RepID=UPI0025ABF72E|nr:heavy metal-associated isoprenylated plant protein 39 isoform X1 [Salvia miltiorrhiza]
MAQKLVVRVLTMTDEKTKQKAMEAAADILGVDSIAADVKDQKVTVVGQMDVVAVVNRLKKVGKLEIMSVGPAKEPLNTTPIQEDKK